MLDYVGAILGCLEAILYHVGLSWDHLRPSCAVLRPFWIMLGCIEAMLWLSGEHLGPYWGGMGVKVWEMPCGLGGPGHKVCVLPRGWGVRAIQCGFCHADWGVLWAGKVRDHGRSRVLAAILGF
jgi:hypothetical protein